MIFRRVDGPVRGHEPGQVTSMRSVSVGYVSRVCALAAFSEVLFYTAIAPILPSLARELGLGGVAAGLLVAAYGIGCTIGSYPAVRMVSRWGPGRTALAGFAVAIVGSLAFAADSQIVVLFASRLLAGMASSMICTGVIALASDYAGPEHRGAMIGGIYSGIYAGSAVGPLIGTAAAEFGRGPVFALLAAGQLVVGVLVGRLPEVCAMPVASLATMLGHVRCGRVLLGLWMNCVLGVGIGVVAVAGTYRIDDVGGSPLSIAVAFSAIAVICAALGPVLGRITDTYGRRKPLIGLMLAAAVALGILIPAQNLIAVVVLITVGGSLFRLIGGPGYSLVGDGVELRGGSEAESAFLVNLFWGPTAALGSLVAGYLLSAGGTGFSFAVLVAVAVASAGLLSRGRD